MRKKQGSGFQFLARASEVMKNDPEGEEKAESGKCGKVAAQGGLGGEWRYLGCDDDSLSLARAASALTAWFGAPECNRSLTVTALIQAATVRKRYYNGTSSSARSGYRRPVG